MYLDTFRWLLTSRFGQLFHKQTYDYHFVCLYHINQSSFSYKGNLVGLKTLHKYAIFLPKLIVSYYLKLELTILMYLFSNLVITLQMNCHLLNKYEMIHHILPKYFLLLNTYMVDSNENYFVIQMIPTFVNCIHSQYESTLLVYPFFLNLSLSYFHSINISVLHYTDYPFCVPSFVSLYIY